VFQGYSEVVRWWIAEWIMASHVVCLFVVTSGQNDESLGCDEEQIVVFAYTLIDVANNKVRQRIGGRGGGQKPPTPVQNSRRTKTPHPVVYTG